MDGQDALLWAQVAMAGATALATAALVYFTWMLADRSSQAHVIATLEANKWSIIHVDLVIANTGNAAAYDVELAFDPPLASERLENRDKGMPFKNLVVLKPGQTLASFVGDYSSFKGTDYAVTVTWSKTPGGKRTGVNSYGFCIDQFAFTRLGEESPELQVAREVKKIREEWGRVASGFKRLNVNVYSSSQRDED